MVVSQAFAKQFYPNENPLGKRIVIGWGRQRSENKADTVNAGGEIVGVIGDVKSFGANEAAAVDRLSALRSGTARAT